MFGIRCLFTLFIFFIFDRTPYLVSSSVAEDTDILKAESNIRKTANALFYSLGLRKVQLNPRIHQYALTHNYFISLTLQDYVKLQEIIKLTRIDKENGTTDFIAILNEIQNEDNVLKLQNMIMGEDSRTRYDVTGEIEKFEHLKKYHEERYNRSWERINDIKKFVKQEESLEINNITNVDGSNNSDNFDADMQSWSEDDDLPIERRIYGGKRTKIKHYPFMASVQIFGKFQCGGCIIQSDLVITAASCLQLAWNNRFYRENPAFLSVRVGSTFYEVGGEAIDVLEVYFHPSYNPKLLRHNLAIIRLVKKIRLKKKVKKILIGGSIVQNSGKILTVGWGAHTVANKMLSPWDDMIRHADLDLYDLEDCQDIYSKEYVTQRNFCGGFMSHGTGPCNRDVGGPGIMSGKLVGIISFGAPTCGAPDTPTVFTKLKPYLDWIEDIMGQPVPTFRQPTTLKPRTYPYPSPRTHTAASWDITPIFTLQPGVFSGQSVGLPAVELPKHLKYEKKLRELYQKSLPKIYKNKAFNEPDVTVQDKALRVTAIIDVAEANKMYLADVYDEPKDDVLTTMIYKEHQSSSSSNSEESDDDSNASEQKMENQTSQHEMPKPLYAEMNKSREVNISLSHQQSTPPYPIFSTEVQNEKVITTESQNRQTEKPFEIQENTTLTNQRSSPESEKLNTAYTSVSIDSEETTHAVIRIQTDTTLDDYMFHTKAVNKTENQTRSELQSKFKQPPMENRNKNNMQKNSQELSNLRYPEFLSEVQKIVEPVYTPLSQTEGQSDNQYNLEQDQEFQEAAKLAFEEILTYQKQLPVTQEDTKFADRKLPTPDQDEVQLANQKIPTKPIEEVKFNLKKLSKQKNIPTQNISIQKPNNKKLAQQQSIQDLEQEKIEDHERLILAQETESNEKTLQDREFSTSDQERAKSFHDKIWPQEQKETNIANMGFSFQNQNNEDFFQDQEEAQLEHVTTTTIDHEELKLINLSQEGELNIGPWKPTTQTHKVVKELSNHLNAPYQHQKGPNNKNLQTQGQNQIEPIREVILDQDEKKSHLQKSFAESQKETELASNEESISYPHELSQNQEKAMSNYRERLANQKRYAPSQEADSLVSRELRLKYNPRFKTARQKIKKSKTLQSLNQGQTKQNQDAGKRARPIYQTVSSQEIAKAYETILMGGQKSINEKYLSEASEHLKSSIQYENVSKPVKKQTLIKPKKNFKPPRQIQAKQEDDKAKVPKLLNKMEKDVKSFLKNKIDSAILSLLNESNTAENKNSNSKKTTRASMMYNNNHRKDGNAGNRSQWLRENRAELSNENQDNKRLHQFQKLENNSIFKRKDINKLISLFKAASKIEDALRSGKNVSSLYNDFLKLYSKSLEKSASGERVNARRIMDRVTNETGANDNDKIQNNDSEEDKSTEEFTKMDSSEAETIKRNVLDYINI